MGNSSCHSLQTARCNCVEEHVLKAPIPQDVHDADGGVTPVVDGNALKEPQPILDALLAQSEEVRHWVTSHSKLAQKTTYADDSDNDSLFSSSSILTDVGSINSDDAATTRHSSRHNCKKVKVTQTMGGPLPSAALKFDINNPLRVRDVYKFDGVLGAGNFGTVHLATLRATGHQRAIKTIAKEKMKQHMESLKLEIEIMMLLDHPGTIMLYEIFEDDEDIHFCMDVCPGGSLTRRVKCHCFLKELEVAEAMRQIMRAVHYLHKHNVVHRDLKSDNVLMKVGPLEPLRVCSLKLTDFGLSCFVRPGQILSHMAGTKNHMAPEVFARKYDHRCDIWSCGVIMYYMMSGTFPFANQADIEKGKLQLNSQGWQAASQNSIDFMKSLLTKRLSQRISTSKCLEHPWLSPNASEKRVKVKDTILASLRRLRDFSFLQRAVLSLAASLTDDEKISASQELFNTLDVDCNGIITFFDLKLSLDADRESIKEALLDTLNGNVVEKGFTYTEFIAATLDTKLCLDDNLLHIAFQFFDRDGDGRINLTELSKGHLLDHVPLEELAGIMKCHDLDGDTQIDLEEFKTMMRQTAPIGRRLSVR